MRQPAVARWRSAVVTAIGVATTLCAPAPASAAVNITPGPAFAVAITAGEDVSVDCSGGFVRVTADAVPTVTGTACASVTSLTVDGGPGDNVLELFLVSVVDFTAPLTVTITGGDGADAINGSLFGDSISGGDGPDTITGDNGNDVVAGGSDDDMFFWNPGDGNDTVTGDAGADALAFTGANVAEQFAITREGSGFDLTRNVGTVTLDVDTTEHVNLVALAGDDAVTTAPLPLTSQTFDGGTHSVGDSASFDLTGFCFSQSAGVWSGIGFGTITLVGFEFQTVTGSGGDCNPADVDDNGDVDPLTDGLLLVRYFFGFREGALVAGVVADDCGRCTAPEIEAFIQSLYP